MAGEVKTEVPKRLGGGFIKKLVILIIVILIVLWFVRRDLVIELWDWILELF